MIVNILDPGVPSNLTIPGVALTTGQPPSYGDDIDVRLNGSLFCWVREYKSRIYSAKPWTIHFCNALLPSQHLDTRDEALSYAMVLARLHQGEN